MKSLRILVVEDDPIVAADLRESLQEMGHHVAAVAHDGDSAARRATEERVELAVVDIRMPGSLDGVDLARSLRAELDIPVIFVTAFADEATQERARSAEPWAYLIKPFDVRELEMSIALAMQHRERERLLRKAEDALDPDRRHRNADRDAEERYRMIFSENPMSLCLLSLDDHRILDVNLAFEKTFGWTRSEIVGVADESIALWVHAEDRARILDLAESVQGVDSFRTALRTKNGDGLEIDLSVTPVVIKDRPAALFVCTDVTDRATMERELERMALYDSLTGLPNRSLFLDRLEHTLERARRVGHDVGVLFVDLDGFKAVNDTYGHAAGDAVLRAAAARIASALRHEDTVARLGGDEFTVILEDEPTVRGAKLASRRILDVLGDPFEVEGRRISLSASIGIAVRRAAETNVDELIEASDEAMYDVKKSGGGGVRTRDEGASRGRERRESLRSDLLRALEEDEMVLRFDPIVTLEDRRTVGAEALLRWSPPDGGLLAPADFLPLAREEGLGMPVCAAFLEKACRQLRRWKETHGRQFFLTMDLACCDLENPEIEDVVEDTLDRAGFPRQSLRVEVSTDDLRRHERKLARLRRAGLGIVVRGFGSGTIPLGLLWDGAPAVDQVKLDPDLIGRCRDSREETEYLRGLIGLARGMGTEIIAGALTNESHIRELRSLGAKYGQGSAFGEARPAEDLLDGVLG